ncbi:hypothetical protein C0989_012206 [Termitomyces sp. Mn162]|nr:hypothetical protein C0989_012206 [Termitomyces sp. Mn162]
MEPTLGVNIAYELQDEIIKHLQKDFRSLAMCSLVSSRWSEYARALLFSDFQVIISLINDARTTKLAELLVAPHSRLAQYIRRINIYGPDIKFDRIVDFNKTASPEAYNKFSSILEAVLPHLTHVRRLTVQMITWSRTPKDVKVHLASLSQVVSVTWIEVHFGSLYELILFSDQSFPALETLHIQDFDVEDASQIGQSMLLPCTTSFACLRALALCVEKSTAPLISALLSNVIAIQKFDTLDLEVFSDSLLDQVGCLIRAAGPTLTVLKFQMYTSGVGYSEDLEKRPFPISLSQNVHLKLLHFNTILHRDDMWWLKKILSSASTIRGLEEIRFGLQRCGTLNFERLGCMLFTQSEPNFSVVLEYIGEKDRELSEMLQHLMPKLSRRARLSIICFNG